MNAIRDLPEVAGLERHQDTVRIPAEIDVPLTPRVRAILDTAEFRRLAHVSQLGLVSLVYPAAQAHAVRTFAGRVPAGADCSCGNCRTTSGSRLPSRRPTPSC